MLLYSSELELREEKFPIMESSTSYRLKRRQGDDAALEKFLFRVILPAVRGLSCPICLASLEERRAAVITNCLHAYCAGCIRTWSDIRRNCPLCNAEFSSLFFGIDSRVRRFREERLPPLCNRVKSAGGYDRSHANRRIIRISRDEVAHASSRTRPLPWRRSFGRPGSVPSQVITERKLQWRASVYDRHLRAVPLSSRSYQDIPRDSSWKDSLLNKIEPWIRRELEAILGDPDPSIIVHVVTSLFMETIEKKSNNPSIQVEEDNPTASLRPFLHERADMFWHELRCFAESSFSMETYDVVVEYRQFKG